MKDVKKNQMLEVHRSYHDILIVMQSNDYIDLVIYWWEHKISLEYILFTNIFHRLFEVTWKNMLLIIWKLFNFFLYVINFTYNTSMHKWVGIIKKMYIFFSFDIIIFFELKVSLKVSFSYSVMHHEINETSIRISYIIVRGVSLL